MIYLEEILKKYLGSLEVGEFIDFYDFYIQKFSEESLDESGLLSKEDLYNQLLEFKKEGLIEFKNDYIWTKELSLEPELIIENQLLREINHLKEEFEWNIIGSFSLNINENEFHPEEIQNHLNDKIDNKLFKFNINIRENNLMNVEIYSDFVHTSLQIKFNLIRIISCIQPNNRNFLKFLDFSEGQSETKRKKLLIFPQIFGFYYCYNLIQNIFYNIYKNSINFNITNIKFSRSK